MSDVSHNPDGKMDNFHSSVLTCLNGLIPPLPLANTAKLSVFVNEIAPLRVHAANKVQKQNACSCAILSAWRVRHAIHVFTSNLGHVTITPTYDAWPDVRR